MANNEEETKGKTSKIDAELWLEGRGLPAASMDPASLNALSDLLSGQHVDFNDPTGMQRTKFDKDSSARNTLSNHESDNDFMTSRDLLDRRFVRPDSSEEDENDDLLASPAEQEERVEIPPEASVVERLILQKLDQQTKLLKNMEKRLCKLENSGIRHRTSAEVHEDHRQQRFMEALKAMELPEREPRNIPNPPPVAPRPRVVVHARVPAPPPQQQRTDGVTSRLYKCISLFVGLRRQQVPNDRIDGWMLIKIMFMLSILLSKDQSKLFTTLSVVFVGFLWQSGLAGFLYKFVVRYNYIGRILLRNEDITVASALAEQRGPTVPARDHDEQEQVQQQRPWWLVDPERPAIYNLLIDFLMIIGSLFLSIFPMWRVPDPPPRPDVEEDNGEEEDNPPEDGTIPVVRPPVDPAAADSDDDEEPGGNIDGQ